MKIAVDISPISKSSESAHKVRGVGSYIKFLVENLPKYDKTNQYVFVENKKFPADADLIHYPYFDPFFITIPLKSNKKFVVTVHDLTPLVFPQHFPAGIRGKINWQIQKRSLRQASVVIADSKSSKKDIEDIGGIEEEKVKVAYLAADAQFKKIPENQGKLSASKFTNLPEKFLLYVGDATWNKNLPRLIEAVRGTKYRLALVGKVWEAGEVSNNPWNRDLRDVLKKIERDQQFIKLGYIPDEELVRIYNDATALIMPSVYEGFGLPVLEAMNCGCPVISSRGGSLPEIGDDAVYYIKDLDAENIRLAIEKVMGDPGIRTQLSNDGLSQAGKFTAEKSIGELVEVYRSVI